MELAELEAQVEQIRERIDTYQAAGKKLFATCSFQSHSLPLLHILSRIDQSIPVFYTNTGFLFPETIRFAEQICERLGIDLRSVRSDVPKNRQMDRQGRFLYASDPDHCCYLNKVQPLEPILMEYDVWINGIRGDQSDVRRQMGVEQPAPYNCVRYHPMLDWNSKMIHYYRKHHDLPPHPLEEKGYLSIGCEPCTAKFLDEANERNSRWFGMNKTECGLHTTLATDKAS